MTSTDLREYATDTIMDEMLNKYAHGDAFGYNVTLIECEAYDRITVTDPETGRDLFTHYVRPNSIELVAVWSNGTSDRYDVTGTYATVTGAPEKTGR